MLGVEEPEVLGRGVGQQVQEGRPRLVLGVHLLRLLHHLEGLVVAAGGDAGRAALAEVGDEDGEDPAAARALPLRGGEDGVGLGVGHGHPVEDGQELVLGRLGEAVHLVHDLAEDLGQGRARLVLHRVPHEGMGALVDLRDGLEHLLPLARVLDVVDHRGTEEGGEVLGAVGKRRVRADGDALHALGAVLGDVHRGLAAGHVLGRGVAAGRRHHPHRGQGRGGLVVAQAGAELLVEGLHPDEGQPLGLAGRGRHGATAAAAADHGQQGRAAQARPVGGAELAHPDLAHLLEALEHDLHVGVDHRLPQPAELLLVLPVDDLAVVLLVDAELGEHRRDREEGAQEGVALHAQLEVGAVGGLAGDPEAAQGEDADLLVEDLLAGPGGQPLPGLVALFLGLPDEGAALGHAVERVRVGEGLGVAAEDHGDVAQVAVHPDALGGHHQEVGGGGALLLRAVLGVRADVDDLAGPAQVVHHLVALGHVVVELADDRAQVLAGGDGAPAADGVEAHRDGALGQQRRRVGRLHFVGVIHAQDHEGGPVRSALPVLALAGPRGVLVGADDVLGPEVAGAQAVDAVEEPGHLRGRDLRLARAGPREPWRARCGCRGPAGWPPPGARPSAPG